MKRTGFMAITILTLSVSGVARADTEVTYQGRLTSAGQPADGTFDFAFSLWDAEADGNQIGAAVTLDDVKVTEGLFTVQLDFGAEAFDNSDRWIEIVVNGVTLSPRQPVTRAPYAIQTRGIFVDDGGRVGIGTTSPNASRALTIQGSDAGGVAQWIGLADLNGDTQWHINHENGGLNFAETGVADFRLFLQPGGFVGIGTGNPFARLHVVHALPDGAPAIFGHQTATSGGGIGVAGQSESFPGIGVSGVAIEPGATGVRGVSTSGEGNGVGVRGSSNSVDGFDFFAAGLGEDYGTNSSRRWKRNIANIEYPLAKIARLRGVYFDWDEEHGGHHDVGFIAEEVGEVLPEIVVYEENGVDAIGMDYSKMTPLLVEAVNALRAQHDREVALLRAEIAELKALLSRNTPIAE